MSLSSDQVAILKVLLKAKPELRKTLLKHADKAIIGTLCDCVYNLLLGNIDISDLQKKNLGRHKKFLRNIAKKGCSWKSKKKIIQKGGNILIPLLLPILTSILTSFI